MSLFSGTAALGSPNDPIVTTDDFFEWVGVTAPSAEETARAQTALEIVSALVRSKTGRQLTRITEAITMDGSGRREITLPDYPVVSITSITEVRTAGGTAEAVTGYLFSPNTGLVDRTDFHSWTSLRNSITVNYTHGYDPLPRDLAGVVLSFSKRLYDAPDSAPITQEVLGAYSVSYGAGGVGLTDWEADVISRYRSVL